MEVTPLQALTSSLEVTSLMSGERTLVQNKVLFFTMVPLQREGEIFEITYYLLEKPLAC